jgi:4,5-DOPA dioxygenase extradiol
MYTRRRFIRVAAAGAWALGCKPRDAREMSKTGGKAVALENPKQGARMPVLFVGHGSPMNAVLDNAWSQGFKKLGTLTPRPQAILAVSAHWFVDGTYLMSNAQPKTIHDFGGFPQELYEIEYPAPGKPELAARVRTLIGEQRAALSDQWGLDHGTWSVLRYMFPDARVPVVQLSLDRRLQMREHHELARSLGALRDEGVLIVASGNIVHNLRLYKYRDATPLDWALRFDEDVAEHIATRHHDGLLGYETLGSDALLAIPTPEHYLPLLYALGLQREDDPVEFFNDEVQSAISMRSVLIGHA